jgi:hypothetical protein
MRPAGFTLAELLIATTVGTLVIALGLRAWGPGSQATLALRDRARADTELRLAVDALLADLGGAQTALPGLEGELVITRLPALALRLGAFSGGDDDGIEWSFDDGELWRFDRELDSELLLAAGLAGFDVTASGGETRVMLSAGAGADARSLELAWPH